MYFHCPKIKWGSKPNSNDAYSLAVSIRASNHNAHHRHVCIGHRLPVAVPHRHQAVDQPPAMCVWHVARCMYHVSNILRPDWPNDTEYRTRHDNNGALYHLSKQIPGPAKRHGVPHAIVV
jgi:hypothetical protein